MVWLILDYLANGDSVEEILASYPDLTSDDIRACLAYAAEAAREKVVAIEESSDHAVQAFCRNDGPDGPNSCRAQDQDA